MRSKKISSKVGRIQALELVRGRAGSKHHLLAGPWRGVVHKLRRGVQPVRYLSHNARMISRRRHNEPYARRILVIRTIARGQPDCGDIP